MDLGRMEYIARLVARVATGEAGETERRELELWHAERPENEAMLSRQLARGEFERNVERFANKGDTVARRLRTHTGWIRYVAAAAVVAVAAMGGYRLFRADDTTDVATPIARVESSPVLMLGDGRSVELVGTGHDAELTGEPLSVDAGSMSVVYEDGVVVDAGGTPAMHTLIVPRGSSFGVVLSDGTRVGLNAGSSLKYPTAFTGGVRRVELRGEAWFEVEADAAHPFVVSTGEVDVMATGTAFDVRAYDYESQVRAVLAEGGVVVGAAGQTISIVPGMHATYDRADGVLRMGQADLETLLAWRSDRFAYDGSTLEEIFTDLGRWYDFEVEWGDEQSRTLRYSLDIRRHEGIEAVLKMIEATQKVDFAVDGKRVTVTMRK